MDIFEFMSVRNEHALGRLSREDLGDYLSDQMTLRMQQKHRLVIQRTWQSQVDESWVDWFQKDEAWSLTQLSERSILAWHSRSEMMLSIRMNQGNSVMHGSSRGIRRILRDIDSEEEQSVSHKSRILTITVSGSPKDVAEFNQSWTETYPEGPVSVKWLHDLDDMPLRLPLASGELPDARLYPYFKDAPKDLYDKFIESDANILLLMGPPGTGKTSFIRGLLQHTRSSATVSYDPKILERDTFFANFLEGDTEALVLEDADNFLMEREDGNEVMHRFLSIGNGLVSIPRKKLIFSTNLNGLSRIDSALTRPGRCFAVLEFRELNFEEAKAAAEYLGIPVPAVEKSYTLAELTNAVQKSHTSPGRNVGFSNQD